MGKEPSQQKTPTLRGLTVPSLLLMIGIILGLAGVVMPKVSKSKTEIRRAQLLELIQKLEFAGFRHLQDTGTLAVELQGISSPEAHGLSLRPKGVPSWRGPYIEHVLGPADNPFGGTCNLHDHLGEVTGGLGFDERGEGKATATGRGNFLRLSNIPEDVARFIDQELDALPSPAHPWQSTGRVLHAHGILEVLLLDQDPG